MNKDEKIKVTNYLDAPRSKCCDELMRMDCGEDFGGKDDLVTCHYVCLKCNQPADVAVNKDETKQPSGTTDPQKCPRWEDKIHAILVGVNLNGVINDKYTGVVPVALKEISKIITTEIAKARQEEREKRSGYRVSWDMADDGDNWVVQFWKVGKDGKMELFTQLDKNSDNCGNFDFSNDKTNGK